MTRNEFLKWIGGSAMLSFAACGGGSGKPDAAPDAPAGCTTTDAKVMIATNHVHGAHVLVVPKADVAAAVEKTYGIMGEGTHNHTVTVTAAQFMMLQGAASIMITSTEADTHTHVVTISC